MNQTIHQHLENNLPRIRAVVRALAHDANLTDDLTQECCVRIIEKEHLWDRQRDPVPWMTQIARRLTFSRLKSGKKTSPLIEDSIEVTTEEDAFDPERIFWVLEQFQSLPNMQKSILQKKYFDGKSGVRIARELGITPQSVTIHHKRAIANLQKRARTGGLLQALVPFFDIHQSKHLVAGEFMKYKLVTTLALIGSIALTIKGFDHLDDIKRLKEPRVQAALASQQTVSQAEFQPPVADSQAGDHIRNLEVIRSSLEKEVQQLQSRKNEIDNRSVGEHVATALRISLKGDEHRKEDFLSQYIDCAEDWGLDPETTTAFLDDVWNHQMQTDNLFLDLLEGLDPKIGIERSHTLYDHTKTKLSSYLNPDQVDEVDMTSVDFDRESFSLSISCADMDDHEIDESLFTEISNKTRQFPYLLGHPLLPDEFKDFRKINDDYIHSVANLGRASNWSDLILKPWSARFDVIEEALLTRYGRDQIKPFLTMRSRYENSLAHSVKTLESVGPKALGEMVIK